MSSCEVFNPSLDAAIRTLGKFDVNNYMLLTENKGPLIDPFAILDTLTEAYPERKAFYDSKRYELRKGKIWYPKGKLIAYQKFEGEQKVFRDAMYNFIRGLRINIVEEGGTEFSGLAEQMNAAGNWEKGKLGPPVAAFDMLQKVLALPANISDMGVAKQTANIAYAFLGRKSKLGKDLWFNIGYWKDYKDVYNKYDILSKDKNITIDDIDVIEEIIDEGDDYSYKRPENLWAHKQAVIEFLAQGLLTYNPGSKEKVDFENPDIDTNFFQKFGLLTPYAGTKLKTVFATVYNWLRKLIKGQPFTKYDREKLDDLLFDIVDDVYKKDFKKWIRGVELKNGMLYDKKGNLLQQKFYKTTLEADEFANDIITKLFNELDPSGQAYKLSGSQVLRKYGNTYRSFSEDVHDIDGIITLPHFKSEANSREFVDWIQNRGLPLMRRKGALAQSFGRDKFNKEIIPFLEGQSWYRNLQDIFPSWKFQTSFIGKDHKTGESITITGYVEHPTRFEVDEETGEVRPKRYILDFFLRTGEGAYPLVFDNYWLDWKQIFMAKLNMGRGKDLTDMIYYSPYLSDKYQFKNGGFRYFSFADDLIEDELSDIEVTPEISDVYETSKELSQIGTPEQYAQYINQIFPTNTVVWKGHNSQNQNSNWFSLDKKYAEVWGSAKPALINTEDVFDISEFEKYFGKGANLNLLMGDFQINTKFGAQIGLLEQTNPELAQEFIKRFNESSVIQGPEAGFENQQSFYVKSSKNIHELGSKKDIQDFKKFVSGTSETTKTVVAYQGAKGPFDDRGINYFTVDVQEARNYGGNVRKVDVDTSNYLDDSSKTKRDLQAEFTAKTGITPNILDNSAEGLKNQADFFEFLKSKGYKGLDLTMYSDSQYLISFDNETFDDNRDDLDTPQYQKSLYDISPAAFKKSIMARYGDTNIYRKKYLAHGGYDYAINAVNTYNKENGNLRFLDVVKEENDLRNGTQLYYIQVFKTPLPIGPEKGGNGIDRAWFIREIAAVDALAESIQTVDNQTINEVLADTITREQAETAQALQVVKNMAASMNMLNEFGEADVNFITKEEARELTKNTRSPYNNEAGFFFNGKVYIVEGGVSVNSLFHEFAHPFVKFLAHQNPELFSKLAQKAWAELGKMGLQDAFFAAYPELAENSQGFHEEVIVHALTTAAQAQLSNTPVPNSFKETISNILYQIKRFFRKLFGGKPKLSDLGVNTSLMDLANEMLSERFAINDSIGTKEDILEDQIQYAKEINDFIKELDDAVNVNETHKALQKNIDAMYKLMSDQLRATTKDEYQELALLLTNDEGRDIAYITSTLSSYESNRTRHIKDLVEDNRKLAIAFVNSLQQMAVITNKIKTRIVEIRKGPKSQENLYRAKSMNDFLDSYIALTDKILDDFTELGIEEDTDISLLVSQIRAGAVAGKKNSLFIYGEGLVDTLWEFVEPTADKIDERWLKRKAYLENSRTASPRLLALEEAAYNSIKLTKESFADMINGDIVFNGAGSQLNSLFESYLINQDPVVGSFAKYLKTNYVDMEIKVQDHKVRFANEVMPALKKAGVNSNNLLSKSDIFLMEDSIAEKAKDGNLYEFKVLKYLDEFVGHEWWDAQQKFEIEKARQAYYSSLSDDDRKAFNKLKQEYDRMRRLYFNNRYKQEFYDRQELFERDDIGAEAKRRLDEINENLQIMNDMKRQGFEIKDETEKRKLAQREKRFLYSLTDNFGNLKTGDEMLIAERLREYRDLSRGFYESRPRPGVFLKALLDYEQQLLLKPSIGGDRTSEEFLEEREKWLTKNTRQSAKAAYYDAMSAIYEGIKQLEDKKDPKIKNAAAQVIKDELAKRNVDQDIIDKVNNVSDLYAIINDIASLSRDENKMVAVNEITEEALDLIKNLQEVIVYTKENSGKINNLTQEENDFLIDYVQRFTLAQFGAGQMPSQDEQDRATELYDKQSYNGLTPEENKKLSQLYGTLSTLREKKPSIYYLDIYSNYISLIDKKFIIDDLGENDINADNADDYFLSDDVVDEIKSQNAQFAIWFDKNHIRVKTYDGKGSWSDTWQRLQVWDYSKPADDRFFESIEIPTADGAVDASGKRTLETYVAAPNFEYYTFDVKPEFLTDEILPNTKDASGNIIPPNKDNKGNWLPKRIAQGAPADSQFINKRYSELRKNDPATFEALEKMKEFYISIQDGKDQAAKLYLELARYNPDVAENVGESARTIASAASKKSKNIKRTNIFSRWLEEVKHFFLRRADSFEEGDDNFRPDDDESLSFFAKQNLKIPIEGKSRLDVNNVSRNFVKSTMRYMASMEKHQKLIELSPVAKALEEFLYDKDPTVGKNITFRNKLSSIGEIIVTSDPRASKRKRIQNVVSPNPRYKSVKYLIEREFEGKKYNDTGALSYGLNKAFNGLAKVASFGYFALDPASALVNYYDALMELKIEGWAFKHINPVSLQVGKGWGLFAMSTVTAEIYKTGPKSVTGQLIEIFDPGQDYLRKSLDDGIARNLSGDIVKMNFLTNTRKWLEMLATMQTMGAMMDYQKVPLTVGTKTTYISYLRAWERDVNGRIKLKDGIDPKYDIGGKEFLNIKNNMQTLIANINGAFSEFDQPEASKIVVYRMVSFIQKHLPRMFQNHYAFKANVFTGKAAPRYNWGANDVNMGFFSAVLNYITKSIGSYGTGLINPSKEETMYILKAARWISILMATSYMKSVFFGYNPDDDEDEAERIKRKRKLKRAPTPTTWKKLYKKSGPLPFLDASVRTNLDKDRAKEVAYFRFNNWLELQALYITTRVGHDQEDWLLWPGFGLSTQSGALNLKTGALMNPTINNIINLSSYIASDAANDPAALYQQDSGVYPWEKEGDPKWYSTMGHFFGLTGSFLDPAGRQKSMETRRKNPNASQ